MFETFHYRRPGYLIGLIVVAVLVSFAFLLVGQVPADSPSAGTPTKKLVRYSFTLTNQTGVVVEDAIFRAFAPVQSTPFQHVDTIESSHSFELHQDPLGNKELEFRLKSLPPHGQKVITITAEVSMWSRPQIDVPFSELIQSDGTPLIGKSARHVTAALTEIEGTTPPATHLAWLKAANSWIYRTFEDVGYVSRDRGAAFALSEQKGDCTEFMHALVALSRAREIPVLPVAGFRIDGSSAVLEAMDYHNWVMFEADGKWGVADPHGNTFDEAQDNYIAFRLLQTKDGQTENSQRFFTHDSRVTVAMN